MFQNIHVYSETMFASDELCCLVVVRHHTETNWPRPPAYSFTGLPYLTAADDAILLYVLIEVSSWPVLG